jgi:CBS domain-containing protein
MKVHEVMTESVQSCQPDTNLAAAAALMWEGDFGSLPVVANDGKLLGIVTDRDIAIALGTRNVLASQVPVSDVMSREVFTCHPSDDIQIALTVLRTDRVRRLPVVSDEGIISGILSLNDVVLHTAKDADSSDLSREDLVNTLKAICEPHQRTESLYPPVLIAVA